MDLFLCILHWDRDDQLRNLWTDYTRDLAGVPEKIRKWINCSGNHPKVVQWIKEWRTWLLGWLNNKHYLAEAGGFEEREWLKSAESGLTLGNSGCWAGHWNRKIFRRRCWKNIFKQSSSCDAFFIEIQLLQKSIVMENVADLIATDGMLKHYQRSPQHLLQNHL